MAKKMTPEEVNSGNIRMLTNIIGEINHLLHLLMSILGHHFPKMAMMIAFLQFALASSPSRGGVFSSSPGVWAGYCCYDQLSRAEGG